MHLTRILTDGNAAAGVLKAQFQRNVHSWCRTVPFASTGRRKLSNSYDYPSGHIALGWLTVLVLAELQPSHESAILTRARTFGESRIICGVHHASAVEADVFLEVRCLRP